MENTTTSIWQSSDEVVDYDELEPETYQRIAEAIGEANPILDIGCGEGKLSKAREEAKALKELRMVLEAGGKLVMVDFIKGGNAEKLWGERHYTPQEIESMLQEASFSELAMELVRDDVIFGSWVKI